MVTHCGEHVTSATLLQFYSNYNVVIITMLSQLKCHYNYNVITIIITSQLHTLEVCATTAITECVKCY